MLKLARLTPGCYWARAENSGSEACYVEVASWCEQHQRWERFAHCKLFTGDIPGVKDTVACEQVAFQINNASNNKYVSIVHSLKHDFDNLEIPFTTELQKEIVKAWLMPEKGVVSEKALQ
jgi:hypothetical protein